MTTQAKRHHPHRLRILPLLACALAIASCDDVTEDSSFQLWCDGELCQWNTEQGEIERVPTWHANDVGVGLVSSPTIISQTAPDTTSEDAPCILFDVIADVEPDAQVTLGVDFLADGDVEVEQAIGETEWEPVRFLVTAPQWYEGVRFVIRKNGRGRAVLAQIRATKATECSGPAVDLESPDGSPCRRDEDCAGGYCDGSGTCSPPG